MMYCLKSGFLKDLGYSLKYYGCVWKGRLMGVIEMIGVIGGGVWGIVFVFMVVCVGWGVWLWVWDVEIVFYIWVWW